MALCGGVEALKTALKDGNWTDIILVLKKIGVLSKEEKTAVTFAAENVVEAAAIQTTTSAIAKEAAKTVVKENIKGVIVVQVRLLGALHAVSMKKELYKYVNGHMDKEEFIDYAIKRSTTSACSLAGGIGGSLAGVAAGTAIGSFFPGIGTVVGGSVGGFVGGVSGGIGGTAFGRLTGNWINWLRKK